MNRDKDEFWAIIFPEGHLAWVHETRVLAIVDCIGSVPHGRGLSANQKAEWDKLYRQGYRARRVRVEVI